MLESNAELLYAAVDSLLKLPEFKLAALATVYGNVRAAVAHLERIHALCGEPQPTLIGAVAEAVAAEAAQPPHPPASTQHPAATTA